MTTHGIRVYFTNDQTGIPDATHTKVAFDTVMYDTDAEWDAVNFIWKPKFSVATIVRVTAHVSWGVPVGVTGVGYGKIWSHWNPLTTNFGLGEGAIDGPISVANPRIGYHDERLCQPGDQCHVAAMFFSGANGHVIQSGSIDLQDDTSNRSYFAASYEA